MALRPSAARVSVMRGSWRVQSALSGTTPRAANSLTTAALCSATRLFTWQVTHQAAVKSTNTAFPEVVSSRTFSGDHSCHGNSLARAWAPAGVLGFGAGQATSKPAAANRIATAGRHRLGEWSQRP